MRGAVHRGGLSTVVAGWAAMHSLGARGAVVDVRIGLVVKLVEHHCIA